MALLKLDVVSAEKSLYSGMVKMVVLPGESGELGVLPGHTPLITRIRPGTVKVTREDGSEEAMFVAGGILEVQPGGVTVLADVAERLAELDEAKAQASYQKAQETLRNAERPEDVAAVEAELALLQAQVVAIQRFKGTSTLR